MVDTAPELVAYPKQCEIFVGGVQRTQGGLLCAGVDPSDHLSYCLVPKMALLRSAVVRARYQSQLLVQRERDRSVWVVEAIAKARGLDALDLLVTGFPRQYRHPTKRSIRCDELASVGVRDGQRPQVALSPTG